MSIVLWQVPECYANNMNFFFSKNNAWLSSGLKKCTQHISMYHSHVPSRNLIARWEIFFCHRESENVLFECKAEIGDQVSDATTMFVKSMAFASRVKHP